jgi:NTE family protein
MRLFDFTIKGGLIKGEKTERFISEILGNTHFHQLKVPLAVVATDFNTAESVVFTAGNLTKAIRASIAVPAVYQPILYLDKLLADGGLSNPVPVTVATEMGADFTIAVNLDHVYGDNILAEIPMLLRVPMQALTILRHNLAEQAITKADIIIAPQNKFRLGLIGWSNFFNKERAMQIIEEGEKATDEMIPEIKKQIAKYQKRQSPVRKLFNLFRIY